MEFEEAIKVDKINYSENKVILPLRSISVELFCMSVS